MVKDLRVGRDILSDIDCCLEVVFEMSKCRNVL